MEQQQRHRVTNAYVVHSGRARFFLWDCACGHSSALHLSASAANDAYRQHKQLQDGAAVQLVYSGEGGGPDGRDNAAA